MADLRARNGNRRVGLLAAGIHSAHNSWILLCPSNALWNADVSRGTLYDVPCVGRPGLYIRNVLERHCPEFCLLETSFNALLDDTSRILFDHIHSISLQVLCVSFSH